MILTPPQHAKSLITSRLFPCLCLARDPSSKLILLSYSAELAAGHGSVARDYIQEFRRSLDPSPGEGRLQISSDTKAKHHWRTTAGGHMISGSIQGTVTGRDATGMIIDDPFKGSEDSGSIVIRDKVWATYGAAVETRLAPDGWTAIINTPWHPDDLCGRLLAAEADEWVVLRFPALAEADDPLLQRKEGEGLFLGRYPQEWYEHKKRGYELRGQSHIWDALYQCKPTGDASLKVFPDSYFGDWLWAEDIPVSDKAPVVCRGLALDPSKSKTGKTGDYAAFADLTLLGNGHIFISMHLNREPLQALYERAKVIVQDSVDQVKLFDAGFLIETNMFQEAVALAVADLLRRENLPVSMDFHHTGSDLEKNARIRNDLDILLANKRIHFVGKTVSNLLTVQQMKELPNGAHDDGPDAISLGRQLLNKFLTGSKKTPQGKVLRV